MIPLTCREFVELITDSLDGALDTGTEARFRRHRRACAGCDRYLVQFGSVIRVLGGRFDQSPAQIQRGTEQ